LVFGFKVSFFIRWHLNQWYEWYVSLSDRLGQYSFLHSEQVEGTIVFKNLVSKYFFSSVVVFVVHLSWRGQKLAILAL
jgi:hypothetical protein